MTAPRRILAVASSAASVLAFAAPAHGATVATTPCVLVASGIRSMAVTTTGFTPGSVVTILTAPKGSTSPSTLTSGIADAAGSFSTTTFPPSFNPFSRNLQTFAIAAKDSVNPALTATSSFQQVRPSYSTNPSSGKPTSKATHTVRGFTPGKNTYLHFRFGGQTKRNVKVGKASAPCGVASKRMALLPTRSRPGTWTVYADQKTTYSKSTSPQLKYSFVIRRTFG